MYDITAIIQTIYDISVLIFCDTNDVFYW
jgi:hypothetical protein